MLVIAANGKRPNANSDIFPSKLRQSASRNMYTYMYEITSKATHPIFVILNHSTTKNSYDPGDAFNVSTNFCVFVGSRCTVKKAVAREKKLRRVLFEVAHPIFVA